MSSTSQGSKASGLGEEFGAMAAQTCLPVSSRDNEDIWKSSWSNKSATA